MKGKQKTINNPKVDPLKKNRGNRASINGKTNLIWLALLGLIGVTFFVFYPMLHNQFTSYDDRWYLTQNTKIWNLNSSVVKFLFTQPMALNYHPFTMLSLGLNYHFAKLNPYPYFLTNLTFHLFNVMLVFWFVYLLSKKNIHVALLTSLIFALHPMHVQSVAWVSERKDVLYTFFFMAGLISYYYYLTTKKWVLYLTAILLALCSMFSKPAAIIFPLLLIVLEYFVQKKISWKLLINKIPFFMMAAFFMYMTFIAQTQNEYVVGDFKAYNIPQRIIISCYGFIIYIFKFFVPYHLANFHPYPKNLDAVFYGSPVIIIILVFAVFNFKEKRDLLIFGFLFFLVNLLLVIQFVSIGDALYAERYTYVPYIGIAFVIGMIVFDEKFRLNKKIVWLIAGIFLAGLSVVARDRIEVWHNDESLWTDQIKKYPDHYFGYYNRGNYYSDHDNFEKAATDFSRAIDAGDYYQSYSNRGYVYMKLKQPELAIKDLNTALQIKPTEQTNYIFRGHLYFDMQKYVAAMEDANKALSLNPNYEAFYLKGIVNKALKNYDEALKDFNNAELKEKNPLINKSRGDIYFTLKEYAKAIADYDVLLAAYPKDLNGLFFRGFSYLQVNQTDLSIADFKKAILLDPNNPRNYGNIAFAYQKNGDLVNARENAEKAQSLGFVFDANFLTLLKK